jgi:hypothetical protein
MAPFRNTLAPAGAVLLVTLSLAACRMEMPAAAKKDSTAATQTTATTTTTLTPSVPVTAAAAGATQPAIVLSPEIPGDLTFGGQATLPGLQKDFDILSWNSFISLNWPPDANGIGDPSKKIGQDGDNPTVWEDYNDVDAVFLAGGAEPQWGQAPPVPRECRALYAPGMRILKQVGKTPTVLTANSQPFNTGPLIDQHGVYTRFNVSVNKPMFDYIVANKLYSRAGQQAFTTPIDFPCGSNPGKSDPGEEGAIMVKSAWMVIDASQQGRFHSSTALVYSPATTTTPPVPASCTKQLLGLVGLHIAHKTDGSSQWVWSTFEHIDNAPSEADVKSGKLEASYNYYDPSCPAGKCPPNQVPPRPWIPAKVSSFHTQVVRVDSFKGNEFAPESALARNADARPLLAAVNPKSVWANYELISTQWPTNPGGPCAEKPGDQLGSPAPIFLANTTLETYVQGTVPNVSSSCIECHNNAATTSGKPSDFTYVLQRAQ